MKSPGHREHPDHKVAERRVGGRLKVEVDGEVLADSSDAVKVEEDGAPVRYYFPRSDVRMGLLSPSETTTKCPFKGTARYFDLHAHGRTLPDAVWSYEEPYEEHAGLKDRVAFYSENIPDLAFVEE